MPNLVVTNACNLDCPFCFASEYRAEGAAAPRADMSVGEFRRLVSFAGTDTVRFCGGEPTLHPQFQELLAIALEVPDRRVFLMTNGLWSERTRRTVAGLPGEDSERITYLVNVLGPPHATPAQMRQLEKTLAAIDVRRVTLGVTLFATDMDFDPLFELARQSGVRHLRYSVAAPTVTDPRSWRLEPERDFPILASLVHGLVVRARREGLHVHSDCGYIPPCMFTEAQLHDLDLKEASAQRDAFSCSGPVDIGPGGEAWRCYGLYSVIRSQSDDFAHGGELAAHFERRTDQLAERFLFAACVDCDHRARGTCGGGCHAFRAVRALRTTAEAPGVDVADDEALLSSIPRRRDESLRVLRRGRNPVVMLRDDDGAWVEQSLPAFEQALLLGCDGRRSVRSLLRDASQPPDAVRRAARLVRRYLETGALVVRAGTETGAGRPSPTPS